MVTIVILSYGLYDDDITQFGNVDASSLYDRSVALISLRSNTSVLSLCDISNADVTL